MTAFTRVYIGRGTVLHIARSDGKGSTLCGRHGQARSERGGPICVSCDRIASRFRWEAS